MYMYTACSKHVYVYHKTECLYACTCVHVKYMYFSMSVYVVHVCNTAKFQAKVPELHGTTVLTYSVLSVYIINSYVLGPTVGYKSLRDWLY